MLQQPLLQQLQSLRLRGMASALEHQLAVPDTLALSFDDRLGLLVQHEIADRASQRLHQRLRWAKLPQSACLEDLDTKTLRGIDRATLAQVTDLSWIRQHLNVLVTGPTGVGKSFLASAIAHAACRADYAVRAYRLPRLIDELTKAGAMHNRSSFFRGLAKFDLLVIDDFGIAPIADQTQRDLLEILDDRYDKKSTILTSQLPVEQWHACLGDPTLADAILDRLVHNSYRLNLSGDSMRKRKTKNTASTTAD
ncbi:IS21-like element helper ATPase IstB [Tabrizicola sp.]|uniref:IS21-like element helper ATPase IstB n=1 Tax=Tabrizicola sp. TaxID=2005166 RepID=UPI0027338545|nr:IS21-like element helper ATPase IstB [Tabrizicola sp.]MDP3197663.1 IS21-like element helper ATPase IstB [Tabrizicola sp.]